MRKVIVMRGISGSGKSEIVKRLFQECKDNGGMFGFVSTDSFFMYGGKYNFNPAFLSEAHGQCFRRYISYLGAGNLDLIVVDNTNVTVAEIAPYMLGADAFRYQAEILNIECTVVAAHMRNTHNVPVETVEQQHREMLSAQLSPWWKVKSMQAEFPHNSKFTAGGFVNWETS